MRTEITWPVVLVLVLAGSVEIIAAQGGADEQQVDANDVVATLERLSEMKVHWEPNIATGKLSKISAKEKQQFFDEYRAEFRQREREVEAEIEELASLGDKVIEPMMDRIKAEENEIKRRRLRERAAKVLYEIGSRNARDALADMLFGRNGLEARTDAVFGSYIRMIKHSRDIEGKREARELLRGVEYEDFVVRVLNAIAGVPVDVKLLERLDKLLQSERHYLRMKAANVLAADPSEEYSKEKSAAIINSIETVSELPNAAEKYQSDRWGTLADNVYYRLTDALSNIEGAEEYLRQKTDKLKGMTRVCVLIALAHMGDASVKDDLYKILTDPKMLSMTNTRYLAAASFKHIGTVDDLPFLRKLAKTDPLEVVNFHGPVFGRIHGVYVNTGERMAPIRQDSDPAWDNVRRSYPIRWKAREIISLIEQKVKNKSQQQK